MAQVSSYTMLPTYCAHLMDGHSYARASEIGVFKMSGTHGLLRDAAFAPCSASVAAGDTALMQVVPFSCPRCLSLTVKEADGLEAQQAP